MSPENLIERLEFKLKDGIDDETINIIKFVNNKYLLRQETVNATELDSSDLLNEVIALILFFLVFSLFYFLCILLSAKLPCVYKSDFYLLLTILLRRRLNS